jgi:AcrR family transcriptional regulator
VSSRPTRPVLAERYDRRQQELVLAAARVFAKRGFDRTSVQELTEEMSLTPAALYHYFGSKETLLIHICDQLVEPLLERARTVLEADVSPRDRLRLLGRLWVEHALDHRDHMLVFQQVRHVIDHGDQWRGVRTNRKRFERLVQSVLDDAADSGQLRLDDRRLALSALLGMVNHTAQWYRPSGALDPQSIADGYIDLVLRDDSCARSDSKGKT